MDNTELMIADKILCTQQEISLLKAKEQEYRSKLSELERKKNDLLIVLRFLRELQAEIDPDSAAIMQEAQEYSPKGNVRPLVKEFLQTADMFTGTQLITYVQGRYPGANASTVRAELSRSKSSGLVQHTGKDLYQVTHTDILTDISKESA